MAESTRFYNYIIHKYTDTQVFILYIYTLHCIILHNICNKNVDITTSLKLEGYFGFLLGEMKYLIVLSGDESQILIRRFRQ